METIFMGKLTNIDWSIVPAPLDDGAARHLVGQDVPSCHLIGNDGSTVDLALLRGRTVIYAFPRTGRPDVPSLEGWDMIPGAKGCTPQTCGFRDHFSDLTQHGVNSVFGLSTQDSDYQQEAALRLNLPFLLLSDNQLMFAKAMRLPTFEVNCTTLLKRLTMIIHNGRVEHVFYPVFPPDKNAIMVTEWLVANKMQNS